MPLLREARKIIKMGDDDDDDDGVELTCGHGPLITLPLRRERPGKSIRTLLRKARNEVC